MLVLVFILHVPMELWTNKRQEEAISLEEPSSSSSKEGKGNDQVGYLSKELKHREPEK